MSSRRLLWVVPGPAEQDIGWDVVRPRGREVVARAAVQSDAVARAAELLPEGGAIEVLNRDGFVLARTGVLPPPTTPRAVMISLGIRFALALALALPLARIFHTLIPFAPAVALAVRALVAAIRQRTAPKDDAPRPDRLTPR